MTTPASALSPDDAAAALAVGPIVFSASRRKTARIAFFSVAFVILGAWEARQPGLWHGLPIGAVGICALVLGLLGGAVSVVQSLRRPTLTLSSTGLVLAASARPLALRWSEVERFEAWKPTAGRLRLVGYTRRGPPRTKMESVARGLGCDGAIPDQFPISPAALLNLCEACRRRWS